LVSIARRHHPTACSQLPKLFFAMPALIIQVYAIRYAVGYCQSLFRECRPSCPWEDLAAPFLVPDFPKVLEFADFPVRSRRRLKPDRDCEINKALVSYVYIGV